MGFLQDFAAMVLAAIWLVSLVLALLFLVRPALLSGKSLFSDRVSLPISRVKGFTLLFAAAWMAFFLLAVIVPKAPDAAPKAPDAAPAAHNDKAELLDALFKVSHELTQCTQSYAEIMAVQKRSENGKASALDVYSRVNRGIDACDHARLGLLNITAPETIKGEDNEALRSALRYECPAALDQAAAALKRFATILDGGAGQLSEAYNMKQEIAGAAAHRFACVAPFVTQAKALGASEAELKHAMGE